ncbi:MAG: PspA/IM30 family protein [Thermoleophilia bacterium]
MSFFGRLKAIFQAKANKALDAAEDPGEMLDLGFEKQTELLQKVRRGVADVATSKKRLDLQIEKLNASVASLDNQARQAITAGREDLARVALERKAAVTAQVQGIQTQREQLQAEQDKLVMAEQKLTTKLESFRVQKETIKAQYSAAEAQAKIGESLSGISEDMADVGMAMDRAQSKVETMRARAGAIDELLETGALDDLSQSGDIVDRELQAVTQKGAVDAELEALKAQLGSGDAPAGQIGAGGPS